jgi:hypothetical protein
VILPRIIRQRDASHYLGMDRNRFDAEVRPELTEIPIGVRGIAYDRQELDAWADAYIAAHGRPGRKATNARSAQVSVLGASNQALRLGQSHKLPDQSTGSDVANPAASNSKVVPSVKPARKMSNYDKVLESCFGPGHPTR